MEVTEEEAIELMDQIAGLFLELEAHQDFERLLDDAIKHKTDWLYLSGHRLTDLPDRIRELTELRQLRELGSADTWLAGQAEGRDQLKPHSAGNRRPGKSGAAYNSILRDS